MGQMKAKVEERLREVFGEEPFHLIALAMSGSHAYGIATEGSDTDLMGVFLPPLSYVLGVKHVEQVHFDKKTMGFEGTAFSFQKWYNLLLQQNPNILELLWHEENMYIHRDNLFFQLLYNRREQLLSKKVKHTYGGYAHAQIQRLKRLNENANSNEKRIQLIQKFGYDTKAASHVFRLLGTGLEILVESAVHVLRPDNQFLLAIRDGKYTYDELLAMANKKIELIEEAYVRSPLRNAIDFEEAKEFELQIIKRWIKEIL